jgi:hypothetical protein
MADFKLRLSDDLASQFDAWAGLRGGRSPALRSLIETACAGSASRGQPLGHRPAKLTVRLTEEDAIGLATAAAETGLTPNAWAAAVLRFRLRGRPTFARDDELALLAIFGELRRIGVNINQIARAPNAGVIEGKVLNLELTYLDELRADLRFHVSCLQEAFAGNLAYWNSGGV